VPGELLVKFRAGDSGRGVAHAAIAATVADEISQLGVQRVKLAKGMSVEAAVKYYRGLRNVVYAEPNVVDKAFFVPNDPMYNQQYSHVKANSPGGWDLTLGNSNVKIAIVDTGVDYNHPELSGKVTKGKDIVNNDDDPMDDQGHGTHCAGIAAAKTNNGVGVAGMGFNCSLIAVKVLNASGVGQADWTAKGIIDAADRGADVISLSIGGGDAQVKKDAVNYAWSKGCVVVAAAGNENTTEKSYPGAYENAIGVGASDQSDQRASFSNYGADWVDVAAPGVAILSTLPGNKYEAWDGTSMACPMVAGLVGLMKSYAPTSTNVQLRAALEANCDPIGNWIAKGRINAYKSINALLRPVNKEFYPKSVAVYANQGTALSGTASGLAKADASRVTLQSINQLNVGTVAAMQSSLVFDSPVSNVRSASFVVAGQAPMGLTVQLYLFNFSTGKYEIVKAFSATGSYQTVTIPVTSFGRYVSGNTVNAIVRGFRSSTVRSTSGYTLSLDVLKIQALLNP
jgi:thermitase